MKLVSYKTEDLEHLGIFYNGHIYNLNSLNHVIPDRMSEFLNGGAPLMEAAHQAFKYLKSNQQDIKEEIFFELIAPIPHPTSLRDAYAFKQHVATARKNRGLDMIPEFDQFPIFYFGNHHAINGPGEIICMPDHFQKLDFELEVAIVINKKGRNIKVAEADDYIAGYMIMNDFSARTLQMEEMKLNLGPAKGKDFATSIGPWLVTKDELEAFKVSTNSNHVGNSYQLNMECWVNDKLISKGDFASMNWTFAEIIERVSYGCDIYPGDVIGSGTVGTGCFLEINGTEKLENSDYKEQWLQPNDRIELRVQGLGILSNIIIADKSDFSLLASKK